MATLPFAVGHCLRLDVAGLTLGILLVTTLAVVSATDLERRIIPNRVLAVAALLGLAVVAAAEPHSLPERLAAAAGGGGVLLAAALVNPAGMGMGDVKLAATMGLFLGAGVVAALLVALLGGTAFGAVSMARHGLAARRRTIPFGPFLALGGIAALLAGTAPVDWYLRAIG